MQPLIEGEAYPPYEAGLPKYIRLKKTMLDKKLPTFDI
jgi:6-phosphofructokinase 1